MTSKTTLTATTPLAELIGANATLHLRRSDVHILLASLVGKLDPGSAKAAGEISASLMSLLPGLADDTALIEATVEDVHQHTARQAPAPHVVDITSTSIQSVEKALRAVGATITEKHRTPGAVGYTTITVQSA